MSLLFILILTCKVNTWIIQQLFCENHRKKGKTDGDIPISTFLLHHFFLKLNPIFFFLLKKILILLSSTDSFIFHVNYRN